MASIVDAAESLLAQEGAPALTMRRVAQEVGVAQAAVHWHVGDRRGLLSALAERWGERLVANPDPRHSWSDHLLHMMCDIRRQLIDQPHIVKLLDVDLLAMLFIPAHEHSLQVLLDAGFRPPLVDQLDRWLFAHTFGSVTTGLALRDLRSRQPGREPSPREETDDFFEFTTRAMLRVMSEECLHGNAPGSRPLDPHPDVVA